MSEIKPIQWDRDGKKLILLDQTLLPGEESYREYNDPLEVAEAIRSLVVRGAPAIGCAAAFGVALAANMCGGEDPEELRRTVGEALNALAETRPTAVNLFWALDRMSKLLDSSSEGSCTQIRRVLEKEAVRIFEEDLLSCRSIGDLGADLVPDTANILTHCNAGALATAGYGTALGVIRSAHKEGKVSMVWVDETRPVLQGARLTAWEMVREGIPATLVTDNMAGALMADGKVDFVIVGADRIAANGDVANKIGTYPLAVLANYHKIPFAVAAPLSTIDTDIASGSQIPIEERDPEEVSGYADVRWAPGGIRIYNPAFDVTPAALITAIVTEKGVIKPPFEISISSLIEKR
jgi:methylthioribose-1-phosphate isomerase